MSDDPEKRVRGRGTDAERSGIERDAEGSNTGQDAPDETDIADDPFAELGSLDTSEASPEELDDLFDPVETADIDDEAVWEAVLSEDSEEPIESDADGVDAVVPKNQYCKRCEFFSAPPDVACKSPGTEIVELVGVDRFRVTNCPVVSRRGRAESVLPEKN